LKRSDQDDIPRFEDVHGRNDRAKAVVNVAQVPHLSWPASMPAYSVNYLLEEYILE